MTDQAFMTGFSSYAERVMPNIIATATLNAGWTRMFPRDKTRPALNEPRTKSRRPKPTERGTAWSVAPAAPTCNWSQQARGREPRRASLQRRGFPVGAILAGDGTEAVVFDLVQPLAAERQLIGFGWEARRDEPGREGAHTQHKCP